MPKEEKEKKEKKKKSKEKKKKDKALKSRKSDKALKSRKSDKELKEPRNPKDRKNKDKVTALPSGTNFQDKAQTEIEKTMVVPDLEDREKAVEPDKDKDKEDAINDRDKNKDKIKDKEKDNRKGGKKQDKKLGGLARIAASRPQTQKGTTLGELDEEELSRGKKKKKKNEKDRKKSKQPKKKTGPELVDVKFEDDPQTASTQLSELIDKLNFATGKLLEAEAAKKGDNKKPKKLNDRDDNKKAKLVTSKFFQDPPPVDDVWVKKPNIAKDAAKNIPDKKDRKKQKKTKDGTKPKKKNIEEVIREEKRLNKKKEKKERKKAEKLAKFHEKMQKVADECLTEPTQISEIRTLGPQTAIQPGKLHYQKLGRSIAKDVPPKSTRKKTERKKKKKRTADERTARKEKKRRKKESKRDEKRRGSTTTLTSTEDRNDSVRTAPTQTLDPSTKSARYSTLPKELAKSYEKLAEKSIKVAEKQEQRAAYNKMMKDIDTNAKAQIHQYQTATKVAEEQKLLSKVTKQYNKLALQVTELEARKHQQEKAYQRTKLKAEMSKARAKQFAPLHVVPPDEEITLGRNTDRIVLYANIMQSLSDQNKNRQVSHEWQNNFNRLLTAVTLGYNLPPSQESNMIRMLFQDFELSNRNCTQLLSKIEDLHLISPLDSYGCYAKLWFIWSENNGIAVTANSFSDIIKPFMRDGTMRPFAFKRYPEQNI